jgi:hypothetical protein
MPASAFRHPSFQSDTGPKKCQTASFYSSTGPVPASLAFLSPVPDLLDAKQSGIPVVSVAELHDLCCASVSSFFLEQEPQ